jgi:hypothetical protein
MRNAVRSRLTYANTMATVAVFLALGGGAFALSGIPDRGGVYHGCVASSGALRVVAKASSCRRAKTVKRGSRRVRIPGESAITWNQQGPRGLQGGQGVNGVNGVQGPPGPTFGATRIGNPFAVPGDPSASPDESSGPAATFGRLFSFNLPADGKVYVRLLDPSIARDCSSGSAHAGLYLDGAPVPRTDEQISAVASPHLQEFVSVVAASAGSHTVEVREDCPTGNPGSGSDSSALAWTVLLLGG